MLFQYPQTLQLLHQISLLFSKPFPFCNPNFQSFLHFWTKISINTGNSWRQGGRSGRGDFGGDRSLIQGVQVHHHKYSGRYWYDEPKQPAPSSCESFVTAGEGVVEEGVVEEARGLMLGLYPIKSEWMVDLHRPPQNLSSFFVKVLFR